MRRAIAAARDVGGELRLRGLRIRNGEADGIEKTKPFNDRALALYDLFSSRIPVPPRTPDWAEKPVSAKFNTKAAALAAAVLLTTGWCSRPLSRANILARVQRRDGRRRPTPLLKGPRK